MNIISVLFAVSLPLIGIILAIIFVASLKRIAVAQEEMASAHKDIAKKLGSILIELRHNNT
ncbi:hypothetical protein ACWXWU_04180 [Shewanella sp. A14]